MPTLINERFVDQVNQLVFSFANQDSSHECFAENRKNFGKQIRGGLIASIQLPHLLIRKTIAMCEGASNIVRISEHIAHMNRSFAKEGEQLRRPHSQLIRELLRFIKENRFQSHHGLSDSLLQQPHS